jgi:hypothetical protein
MLSKRRVIDRTTGRPSASEQADHADDPRHRLLTASHGHYAHWMIVLTSLHLLRA